MHRSGWILVSIAVLRLANVGPAAAAVQELASLAEAEVHPIAADQRVIEALAGQQLRALAEEVLERNPGVAVASARAQAAHHQALQAKALPDPVAGVTGYIAPPETRVGPQRLMATLSQRFPWFGKRGLREQAALQQAAALNAEVEAQRLELVTEVRRLYYELAFLDAYRGVVEIDRETLIHFEQLARTRYASGVGSQQGVVKIQAEITKDDARLLDIAARRAGLVAALNALRDRPQQTPIANFELPPVSGWSAPTLEELRMRALEARPEIARAEHEIERADSLIELAREEHKPDFTLGATYALVGRRTDPAGRFEPPPDSGDDVFGISLSVNLPIQRGRLRAGVGQAAASRLAAAERKRDVTASIDRALGELVERLRLTGEQVRLLERVLLVQAEQSLHSAEAGYAAGGLSSLDLLDAERVLLDVRTAAVRARADYAIALARLEGAVGSPVGPAMKGGER